MSAARNNVESAERPEGHPPSPREEPIREAVVLAAGFGERLRPLTFVRPKPLVPVLNKPLIVWILEHLYRHGVRRVAVNVHHLPDEFHRILDRWPVDHLDIHLVHEPAILGTGGGIRNCALSIGLQGPLLVVNGDTLTDLDLTALTAAHRQSRVPVTMALHDHPRYNQVAVDAGYITGFARYGTADAASSRMMAFTGIQILEPELIEGLPEGNSDIVRELQGRLIHRKALIRGHVAQGHFWRDLGTLRDYVSTQGEWMEHISQNTAMYPNCHRGILVAAGKTVRYGAGRLEGLVCIGSGTALGSGSRVSSSIVWEEVRIPAGVRIHNSIVADGVAVFENLENKIVIQKRLSKRVA